MSERKCEVWVVVRTGFGRFCLVLGLLMHVADVSVADMTLADLTVAD